MIAEAAIKVNALDAGRRIFDSYELFMSMLADAEKRNALEKLEFGNSNDLLFRQQRENSKEFETGLEKLFFESGNDRLTKLTKRYGVF